MTWLAWRQLRAPAAVATLVVLATTVLLGLTGPHLLSIYNAVVAPCAAHGDCSLVTANFQGLDAELNHLSSSALVVAPVLLGIFLGAPLVARELEAGTYRLAWMQSVTRTRWLATRLTLVMLVSVALMGLLSTAVTWWQRPLDLVSNGLWGNFDQRDVVPVAFTVFAVALGVLLGAIARRTLVAMPATIAGYAVVRYLVGEYVRPYLFTPLKVTLPFSLQVTATGVGATIGPPRPTDWAVSHQIVTGAGRAVGESWMTLGQFTMTGSGRTVLTGVGPCPNRIPAHALSQSTPTSVAALQRCIDSFHLRDVVAYQPASRYWPLQWSVAAIFVALAVALCAGALWCVRRRLP